MKPNKACFLYIILILILSSCVYAEDNVADIEETIEVQATKLPIKMIGKPETNETVQNNENGKKLKLFEKKKIDYSEYLIPTEGYMPVTDAIELPEKVRGTISKSPEYNLADCLELALINNPRIKAAYAKAGVYKAKRGEVLSSYTPNINLKTGIGRIKPDGTSSSATRTNPYTKYLIGTIGVSQLVYDFGVTQNKYTMSKIEHSASVDNIDVVVNDVIYQVKDAYYYLIYALENKRVMKETVEKFEKTHRQALGFYEVGMKPKINVTIAEVNLQEAKSKLIAATYEVDVAISKLNNVMGLPFISAYVVDSHLPNEDIEISIKDAIDIANKERPELKIAVKQIELADQTIKLVKKSYFPKLTFDGDFSAGKGDNNSAVNWYSLGGYLTFPTFNPILIKNQLNEVRSAYEQQEYNTRSSVNNIYLEIQEAYARLLENKDRIPVAELGVKNARENYDIAQGRYEVGYSDPIELKDSQITLMNAELSYLKTLYEFNKTKSALERAIGQTLKGTGEPIELKHDFHKEFYKNKNNIHNINNSKEAPMTPENAKDTNKV